MDKKHIVAILLCAGDSTRLWPLSDKYNLTFMGKNLVEMAIEKISDFGLNKIIIVANENNFQKMETLKEKYKKNIVINTVIQKNKRGMAGAIEIVKEKIGDDFPVLIISPSDFFEAGLLTDFDKLLRESPAAVLAGVYSSEYFPGGYLTIENDFVKSIIEKPDISNLPSKYISFVFDYFEKYSVIYKTLSEVTSKKDDIYERAVDELIKKGLKIRFLHYKGFWGYLKYPWHVLNLSSYFLSKIKKSKSGNINLSSQASVVNEVIIGSRVKVMENAKIVGPCFIGDNTIIGNNVVIRESIIGSSCVIGCNSEIARSYIGDNCWFHQNYIGDSVISDNTSMGAGGILANFRLDECNVTSKVNGTKTDTGKGKLGAIIGKNVKIGVNTSIMPGVKIGSNSVISSGVVLDEDIENEKYVYLGSSKYIIKDNKMHQKRTETRNSAFLELRRT
jgi:bifunctional UDP-N-acetylglucosamine pyrophosphorylase/glucosamine-1-phosphate N-acetyltransferase